MGDRRREMSAQILKGYVHTETAYEGANVSCIDTDEGAVLVDTPLLPGDAEEWQRLVAGTNRRGVRFVVNTDHHFDHVVGNHRFGGTVITHSAARLEMLKEGGTLREAMAGAHPGRTPEQIAFILSEPLVPAHITLDTSLTLHVGGRTIEVCHTPGHTAGTVCVHIPEDRILITGDNVTAALHPYKGQANFSQWEQTLARLEQFDPEIIVPGHGEVCTKVDLQRLITYFRELRRTTADLMGRGLNRDQVVDEVRERLLGFFPIDPLFQDRARLMFDEGTGRLYDEIAAGGPRDP
jgi:cyclase